MLDKSNEMNDMKKKENRESAMLDRYLPHSAKRHAMS
jgi:hypothetical protein